MIIINPKASIKASKLGVVSGANPRLELANRQVFIDALVAGNGGKLEIVFDGGEFDWSGIWNMPSGVIATATVDTTLRMTLTSSRFVRTVAGARGNRIDGPFIWDGQGNVSTALLEGNEDDGQLSVSGSTGLNTGSDLEVNTPYFFQVGTAPDCQIDNWKADRMGGVYLRGNTASTEGPSRPRVISGSLTNPAESMSILQVGHHTTDMQFEDLTMGAYPSTVTGGHMISFAGESVDNPEPTILRWRGSNIKHEGRPGVSWNSGVKNGATGDIIAIRSSKDWSLTDFNLSHGGEFAIDAVHGAEDGYIGPGKGVAVVTDIDGCAVIIGSNATRSDGAGGTQIVKPANNVVLEGLQAARIGLDHSGVLGFSSICGVRVLNAVDCSVNGCRISRANGAALYLSNTNVVDRFSAANNDYHDIGTQKIGGDAVWYGQVAAYLWDGTKLSANSGTTTSPATGLINGGALPSGSGGLEEYGPAKYFNDREVADQWRAGFTGAGAINNTYQRINISQAAVLESTGVYTITTDEPMPDDIVLRAAAVSIHIRLSTVTKIDANTVEVAITTLGGNAVNSTFELIGRHGRGLHEPGDAKGYDYGSDVYSRILDSEPVTADDVLYSAEYVMTNVGTAPQSTRHYTAQLVDDVPTWVESGSTSSATVAPVSTADFTTGADTYYPVDVSGEAATSELVATVIDGQVGDYRIIYDSTDSVTATRTISIDGRMKGAANSVVIDTTGWAMQLIWVSNDYGWLVGRIRY